MGVITLTTDFGLRDNFVGVMKGVICSLHPQARLIDISHEMPAHDIGTAAFCLATAYEYFPSGTVHLAVVDPGVGSEREILAVGAGDHFFVAPDNGLLSRILEREPGYEAHYIRNSGLCLPGVGRTFHGRDIMAPVAAHLALGFPLDRVGPQTDRVIMLPPLDLRIDDNALFGRIVYVDGFGNLITNIPNDRIPEDMAALAGTSAGPVTITGVARAYADVPAGAYLAVKGSAGFLEIARNMAPAERPPELTVGTAVEIRWDPSP